MTKIWTVVMVTTALVLMSVGFFLLCKRKFQIHPYPIIAFALLFQGLQQIALQSKYYICKWRMSQIFVWSIELLSLRSVDQFTQWIQIAERIDGVGRMDLVLEQ